MKELVDFFAQGQPHFVFDLDGTLIPIQENRYVATLPDAVRETLAELKDWPITILSGRSPEDLSRLFEGMSVALAPLNGLQNTSTALSQEADQLRGHLATSVLTGKLASAEIEAKGPLTTIHFRHWTEPGLAMPLLQRVQQGLAQLPFENAWHIYLGKKF